MKKLFISLFFITSIIFSTIVSPAMVLAATPIPCDQQGNNMILTIPAWYKGLLEDDPSNAGECIVKKPEPISGFITKIALNVLEMALNVSAYVVVGFIIYGGFKYMLANGSSQNVASAKQTILNAVIGLIIIILSVGVVNFVGGVIK